MFFLNIPCTYEYDLNEYVGIIKMMLSDRLASKEYFYDVYNWQDEIHPIEDAISVLVDTLGFNPINYFVGQFYYTGVDPSNIFKRILNAVNVDADKWVYTNNNVISNCKIEDELIGYNFPSPEIASASTLYARSFVSSDNFTVSSIGLNEYSFAFRFTAFPERFYENGTYDKSVLQHCFGYTFIINVQEQIPSGYLRVTSLAIGGGVLDARNALAGYIADLSPGNAETENENPYSWGGASTIGGGDGLGLNPDDSVKIEFPDLPELDAVSTGLLTIFNPSLSQVNSLGNYLWSDAFDVDTLKKLFGDPMDAIIGLSIVPVKPSLAGSKSVKIGNISTDIIMPYCSKQFVEKSIGSIKVNKYIGSFMDYAPYTKIQIYLPYIGIRDLNPDDVMGETLTVKYHIDILTGGCAAMISVGSKGVMYQYNGSCIANVPLTAINYSGAIQNAVSAIGSGITAVVGMATGASPLTGVGVAGLATSAANTALSSKPSIQRSGSMGGSSGLMSVQQCYLIITRPRMSVPTNLNRFGGYPANINAKLSTLTGLTMIDSIRLDNIPAMETEKQELLSLLQKGVIF